MIRLSIEKIKVRGVRNIREISQYKTIDNQEIKDNSLIRSSRIDKISNKRRNKMFEKYNIGTVIDLRNEVEVEEGKEFTYPDNVEYINLPVIDQAYWGISHERSMRKGLLSKSKEATNKNFFKDYMYNMYKNIVFDSYSQSQFKKFFDIIIEKGDKGILFHCTGGKDRTGIASLFLLSILGVSKEDIVADFSMSDKCNRRYNLSRHIALKILPMKNFRRLLTAMLYAKKEYLLKTIQAIEEKYENIIDYLKKAIGLTEENLAKIREMYIVKAAV